MNKAFAIKLGIIGLVAILLNIPLSMIAGKTSERSESRQSAYEAIARSWTTSQTVIGPILQVPYTIRQITSVWDENLKVYKDKTTTAERTHWFVLDQLDIESVIKDDIRYKGIYDVPVYTTRLSYKGKLPKQIREIINSQNDVVTVHAPILSLSVSDPRGINSIPRLTLGKDEKPFKPGSVLPFNAKGVHVELPEDMLSTPTEFTIDIDLRGMDKLSFIPTSKEVRLQMASAWPHPAFLGDFLPAERTITDAGYQANWQITSFASNIEEKISRCSEGHCEALMNSDFGVRHIDPVDVYLQTERSVKYGFLFIALSFITFFLFEVLKKMAIHSVQYTLVGFAVALFYLLLLALSEHLAFWLAYLLATMACVGLLHLYLVSILKSARHATLFSTVLLLLYGLLYIIIQSEDFALLMGAVLIFIVLGAMMIGTRHIDWFEAGEQLARLKRGKSQPNTRNNQQG